MKRYDMLVNGRWIGARSGATREIRDPASAELVAIVPESGRQDAIDAIEAARQAFDHGPWRRLPAAEKSRILIQIANSIRAASETLAELEVRNSGKPLAEAEIDVADAASCFEYHAGLATRVQGETLQVPGASLSFVQREPIGVCGQIIPWNYPLLMAAWKLAPALAAGCTTVLKPSELTPLTALELGRILLEAGLPPGVVNIITGPGPGPGEELAESPRVDKIAFTGGTETGRRIMRSAASNLKRLTLELGGKNPNIVFADADVDAAIEGVLMGAFANQGQVCSAGSRLLVEASIHDSFVEGLLEWIPRIRLGHGLAPGVKMGPLISAAHRDKVEGYIRLGLEEGARLRCGGRRPEGEAFANGFFLEPAIFDAVEPRMRIAREEIFGPVLCVLPFETEEDAIRIANDTDYGLAVGVWSRDIPRALRVVKEVRAGISWINSYNTTSNELPWGGCKQSGIGRELGLEGLESYLETRTVSIGLDGTPTGWYS